MRELEEWQVFIDNRTLEPHFHLCGKVYGDTRFHGGSEITTSRVVKIENNIAVTKSGSEYRLAYPKVNAYEI